METNGARIGVDTGGTFTDLVASDETGAVVAAKVRSDRPLADALRVLEPLLGAPPAAVVAGTTRATNAVLEGRLARTALVTTEGFADVLAIGRQSRESLYDVRARARPAPPVPPERCFEVAERLGPDGVALVELSREEAGRVARAVEASGAAAVAVCLLHAYANPAHERLLEEALGDVALVSLSHRVSRERREFERANTTALNAALQPELAAYLDDLRAAAAGRFPAAEVFVVHSSGGMMPVARARALPLATVMSGPAAGVAAAARLTRRLGLERAVSVDMGGTSTDACLLLGGLPATARDRRLAGHAIRIPAVAIESIGAGGGSIARVDDVGALRVGPQSAGADPGPAAYGRGGVEATVTDANVVLGCLGLWAPELPLVPEAAHEACARLGARLGLGAEDTALAVVDVANAGMERALRLVTVRRGHDLRDCTLVAYGGAGPMHVGAVALSAGIPRVVVPALSSTFSAAGCCLAELAVDDVRTCLAELGDTGWERARDALDELMGDLAREVGGDATGNGFRAARGVELRYRGQNESLEVAVDGAASAEAVRAAFVERHRSEFGYATGEPVEVTAVRVRLWVEEGTSWLVPQREGAVPGLGETVLRAPEREIAAPVLPRAGLEPGCPVRGPAILVDGHSTVVVWPGLTARADEDGTISLEAER